MNKKYYVVWRGRKTGILGSWEECSKSIHGFKDAECKSFKTLELAKRAYSEIYDGYKGKMIFETKLSNEQLKVIGSPNLKTIPVETTCNTQDGKMEYGGVETKTREVILKKRSYEGATDNIGEFLAITRAVALMKKKYDKRPIYQDSNAAIYSLKYRCFNTAVEKNK